MQENNLKLIARKDLFYLLCLIILFIWGVTASYIAYNKSLDLEIARYKNNELTTRIESINSEVKNWLPDTYKIKEKYKDFDKRLGSFSDFDPNNNAVKEIRVQLIVDRGIQQQGGAAEFYVADKNGKVVLVNGEVSLPAGFEKAEIIIIKGHLSGGNFHVHEILVD